MQTMTRRRLLSIAVATAGMATALRAAAQSSCRGSTCSKIALIAPFTGPFAVGGTALSDGASRAVDTLSKNGLRVQLHSYDSQGRPDRIIEAAHRAIAADGVELVVGQLGAVRESAARKFSNVPFFDLRLQPGMTGDSAMANSLSFSRADIVGLPANRCITDGVCFDSDYALQAFLVIEGMARAKAALSATSMSDVARALSAQRVNTPIGHVEIRGGALHYDLQ